VTKAVDAGVRTAPFPTASFGATPQKMSSPVGDDTKKIAAHREAHMASLNEQFLDWLKDHVAKGPAADFSKGCDHYLAHCKDIQAGKFDADGSNGTSSAPILPTATSKQPEKNEKKSVALGAEDQGSTAAIFGKAPVLGDGSTKSKPAFGSGKPDFGDASMLGGSSSPMADSSATPAFGGSPSGSSMFGAAHNSTALFGGSSVDKDNVPLFGSSNGAAEKAKDGSLFGGSAKNDDKFGAKPIPSGDSKGQTGEKKSPFAFDNKNASSAPFRFGGTGTEAKEQTGTSMFGSSTASALFGGQAGQAAPAATAAGSGLFGAQPSAVASFGGGAAQQDEDGDENDVAPEDESTKDDAPVQTALNDGEKVQVEQRCKAFVWADDSWSDRGVYVTRVVENSSAGYGSMVVKQEAAPFKLLAKENDKEGNPVGAVNFKISSKIPIKLDGKTLTLLLPGKDAKPFKYLLRYKGPNEATEVNTAIQKHSQ